LTKSKCAGKINHFLTKNDYYVDRCQQLTASVKPEEQNHLKVFKICFCFFLSFSWNV